MIGLFKTIRSHSLRITGLQSILSYEFYDQRLLIEIGYLRGHWDFNINIAAGIYIKIPDIRRLVENTLVGVRIPE